LEHQPVAEEGVDRSVRTCDVLRSGTGIIGSHGAGARQDEQHPHRNIPYAEHYGSIPSRPFRAAPRKGPKPQALTNFYAVDTLEFAIE
jgi:hypothetical protein